MTGLLLLVAWPVFTIIVETRCARRRRRGLEISSRLAATQRAIAVIQAVTMMVVLPSAVLGGLSAYWLLTAGDDPDRRAVKIAVGTGALGLTAAPLLFFAHGRSPFFLRLAGGGVSLFGIGGLGAAVFAARDSGNGQGWPVMLLAGVVMICAGLWLAVTGRNRVRRG